MTKLENGVTKKEVMGEATCLLTKRDKIQVDYENKLYRFYSNEKHGYICPFCKEFIEAFGFDIDEEKLIRHLEDEHY